jgi:hypothetical protein
MPICTYSTELQEALEHNDDSELGKLLFGNSWESHLFGYRLNMNKQGKYSITSTPLIEIIGAGLKLYNPNASDKVYQGSGCRYLKVPNNLSYLPNL